MAGQSILFRGEYNSLIDILRERISHQPDKTLYTFLADGENEDVNLTYAELDRQARAIAVLLQENIRQPGERVLLLYPPGLEYTSAFWGCLYAGIIAVPSYPPRLNRPDPRLQTIVRDAQAQVALTTPQILASIEQRLANTPDLASMHWLTTQDLDLKEADKWHNPQSTNETLAFLQYTSGSTAQPRGVMVSHGNLIHNLEKLNQLMGISRQTQGVVWLPPYHDMGLIGGILEMFYTDVPSVFMPPTAFLQKPVRWLQAISRYRGTISGAPNFAYALCAQKITEEQKQGLDLSSWEIAYSGAEPVQRETLELFAKTFEPYGFRREAFYPAYGLAEATLIVTGSAQFSWPTIRSFSADELTQNHAVLANPEDPNPRELVSNGKPAPDQKMLIVDPQTFQRCPDHAVGEIWTAGPSVARGYWNRPEESAQTFDAHLADSGEGPFMRTGDLGFVYDGELFIVGRAKDLIIIRGRNHYPQDIEITVQNSHPAVVPSGGAAFSIDAEGEEKLVIVQEVDRHAKAEEFPRMIATIRQAVAEQHELQIHAVVLIRVGSIPKTSSGKIQRRACKAQYLDGSLTIVSSDTLKTGAKSKPAYVAPRSDLEKIISQAWIEALQVEKVGVNDNFFDLGGHSFQIADVYARLCEKLQRDLTMVELFQYPTINALAAYLSAAENEETASLSGSLRAQLRRNLMKQPDDGIAVIGVVGRFPDAPDADTFWQNLCAGKEAITFFSDDELRAAGVGDELLSNPNYVRAGLVVENIEEFDAFFFGYNPREAALMDPQQRVFLESAWEALEQAGYDSERYAGRIGVYASASANTYLLNNLLSPSGLAQSMDGFQTVLNNDKDFLTTRASYKLGLSGPSVNVQTACSSSLVAIHLACQSLLRGESDMALAGGVSIGPHQKAGYLYEEGGVYSPDGHCRAFDAQAKGIAFGNGVGVVVLKRLSEALADGDAIYAVIKGTAINNDGSLKVGYTAPSVDGQANVIAEAQSMAGIKPETITYIETHGTGTVLGDPIEVAALTKAFGRLSGPQQTGFCAIGSVKTNIGHLDAAAGVTGLIKTVLALHHKEIPPSLYFEQPNPAIDFEHSPFYVNAALAPWPLGPTPRRAGVSSFGIGGTNAHAVLEEAPPLEPSGPSRPWQLLLLSAKTDTALEAATTHLAAYLKTHPEQGLADIAYTLQVGRRIFEHRRAVVCQNADDALVVLETLDPKRVSTAVQQQKDQNVAFMFPGGGGQYVDMGHELYLLEPVFREQVDRCCEFLQPHLGLDLRKILYPEDADSQSAAEQLGQIWLMQPALFVIEYALAQLWMSWGVKPQAMIGHSLGEYVAACLAGVFSLEDALAVMAARGRLMQSQPSGVMLAVSLPEAELAAMLGEGLSLAVVNGPTLCVVAGKEDAATMLEQRLKAQGVECARLHISHASHSLMMEPILELFGAEVKRVKLNPPQIPFVSNLTGEWITAAEATDPNYWVRHLRQTVRFGDGLGKLLKASGLLLLEVGPGQTLSSLALKHPEKNPEQTILPSLRHVQSQQSDQAFLLTTLGKLWLAGVTVDWAAFYQDERRYRVPLPTYPFERQRCWIEPSKNTAPHPSDKIYKKKNIDDWFYTPSWTPSPLRSKESAQMPENCLIFIDESSLGLALAKRLKQKGVLVTTAQVGDGWRQIDDDQYVLDPDCPEHYGQLFSELVKAGKTPDTIMHMWSLTKMGEQAAGPAYFSQMQPLGFLSLVYLTQAINKQDILTPLHIEVLSNGIYTLEGTIQPEKATMLGPCRVIPQELSSTITCRYVDIIVPAQGTLQETRLVKQLMAQVLDEPSNGTFLWRDGQRWEQSFQPLALPKETDGLGLLRENGVYLLTGGLGSIGLMLAEYLAKQVKARLVLTGRSVFPPREEWEAYLSAHGEQNDIGRKIRRIQDMEKLGAEVVVLNADVADREAMQAVIAEIDHRWGSLNGVFHLAGLVHTMSSIQELTTDQYEAHFRPKIYGLFSLEQVLRKRDLDFCVLFSSLASVLGGLGLGSYSAANNFMDAWVRKQSQQGGVRWISVNWDGWLTHDTQHDENTIGIGHALRELAMAPEESMSALQRILGSEQVENEIVVSTANLQARINKWIKLESLRGQGRGNQSATIAPQARPTLHSAYLAPRNETEQMLAAIWQDILGIEQVGIHDNFFELGGHSLLATQVLSKIRSLFQVELPLLAFFEATTVSELGVRVDNAIWLLNSPQDSSVKPDDDLYEREEI